MLERELKFSLPPQLGPASQEEARRLLEELARLCLNVLEAAGPADCRSEDYDALYLDSPDEELGRRFISLRLRREGRRIRLCLKGPSEPDALGSGLGVSLRPEAEKHLDSWLDPAEPRDLERLREELGSFDFAPFTPELPQLLARLPLAARGRARFTRHEARFSSGSGSAFALSLDLGELSGSRASENIAIVELEVSREAPEPEVTDRELEALGQSLKRFGLIPSRFEKARALARLRRIPLLILGAGPAGVAAALAAREAGLAGRDIVLVERNRRIGRKLLATGNGRCNFSNLDICPDAYASLVETEEAKARRDRLTAVWPFARIKEKLDDMGFSCHLEEGRVYPASRRAETLVSWLEELLAAAAVDLRCQLRVLGVEALPQGGFMVRVSEGEALLCDRLIIAGGGRAVPGLGADGSASEWARALGESVTELYPGLVPLTTADRDLQQLGGLRLDAALSADGIRERGELLFTDYGLSGIVAMELASALAPLPAAGLEIRLDFCPDLDQEAVRDLLWRRRARLPQTPASRLSAGLVDLRLGRILWQRLVAARPELGGREAAGGPPAVAVPAGRKGRRRRPSAAAEPCDSALRVGELDFRTVTDFAGLLKACPVTVNGTLSDAEAQLTIGGVRLDRLAETGFASIRNPGLFFCGEVLDVHGRCGGYNLHFAFCSGLEAGMAAAVEA
ncbi:MAG: aminoacetone oxidase family FAD-binding enzyme [Bacillota bacterium]|nr:aminoacetone oxidase family FAD-binding enzyme [Bacillota bacterium]